jgi:NAD(P)-dependent dehydrogenase (short-subunit alcohol dehydrogenase family)
MAKIIIVGGFGPGIATAVAEKFGAEGFTVALVGRNAERLAAGVAALEAKGIKAAAFPADLGVPTAIKPLIAKIRETLGPISVLHWNAYSRAAGDALSADVADLHNVFDVAVVGLSFAVQEALADLKAAKGAVLVTNGGLLFDDPKINELGGTRGLMGLSMGNAAKHKLVGMLSAKLKADDVYVGEVIVTGTIKGSAFDSGNATLDGSVVAQKFWDLFQARTETSTKA